MTKTIVVCGDSFSYGIGCVDLSLSPYGVLVAKKFEANLIRLARGSASNFSIGLQAEYAAEKIKPQPDLIIIGMTSFDRIEWQAEGSSMARTDPVGLENLNYHLYPPHHIPSSPMKRRERFHLEGDPSYNPTILTEQASGLADYINHARRGNPIATGYFKRLNTEPIPKLDMIMKYYFDVFQGSIKIKYDTAIIFQSYMRCILLGLNAIIVTAQPNLFLGLVDPKHLCEVNWWQLSIDYPDSIGSLHTGEEGHRVAAERVISCIDSLGIFR